MNKEYYSTIEAANILRVTRKTVFKWVQNGRIKAERVGRNYIIPHSAVMEKLGKIIGIESKVEIEKAVDKALNDYIKTFKLLSKE